jgi:two-component system copper resistance phosphate regulon response regulator CusR
MRILIVEDEAKVSRAVALGLKAEHYAVDAAKDGREGLELAVVNPYDLLIVDLMLPVLSGTELIRRVREKNPDVPILVLTARDAIADKVTNFESGADDYMTKPFAFAELLVRVKALLRRGTVNRSNIVQIADLTIDRVTHQVQRAGTPIKLTSKEYGLLEYLAIHAGRVLSRTMIMEHVWDESFESLTNIVDVYVRQLRVKIDEPFERKLIHTIRGSGYTLSDSFQE